MTYASTMLLTHRHALGWSSGRCRRRRRHRQKPYRCDVRGDRLSRTFFVLLVVSDGKGEYVWAIKCANETNDK